VSGFPTGASPVPGLRRDPEWFKTAVFYELLVRAFSDTTGSGTG
jgi:maltose alpha-D-glucosyltransferase/alpha-amylase